MSVQLHTRRLQPAQPAVGQLLLLTRHATGAHPRVDVDGLVGVVLVAGPELPVHLLVAHQVLHDALGLEDLQGRQGSTMRAPPPVPVGLSGGG